MKTKSFQSRRFLNSSIAFLAISLSFVLLLMTNSCQKEPGDSNKEPVAGELKAGVPALYYGHEIFTRAAGAPVTELRDIVNPLFDEFEEDGFVLKIQNGDGEDYLVTSAVIKIDGVQVLGPSDFSKNVTFISKPVNLTANSLLSVKLNGKPGTYIDLWIDGIKELGLVAYYPFNENADDESGFNNDGTLYGPTLTTDRFGIENAAYLFNGTSDFIRIEESPSLSVTNGLSVCAWVNCYTNESNDIRRIVSKWGSGNNYFCSFNITFAYGSSLFEVSPDFAPTQVWSSEVENNEWYFIVGTFDGTDIRYYINGELIGINSFPYTLYAGIPLFIGCENGTSFHFNGIIDDVRIYNRALSETEINELYN